MRSISLAEAKAHLSELIEKAATRDQVSITRRGRSGARLTTADLQRKRVDPKILRAITDLMPRQTVGPVCSFTGCAMTIAIDALHRRVRLVAALTNEAETIRMQTWQEAGFRLFGNQRWISTEFRRRSRSRFAPASSSRAIARNHWLPSPGLWLSRLVYCQFLERNFGTAARFADQYVLGLRAGDALHLAVFADHGATIVTLDRRLSAAASTLGVSARFL